VAVSVVRGTGDGREVAGGPDNFQLLSVDGGRGAGRTRRVVRREGMAVVCPFVGILRFVDL
jgi:hypothetical protein